MSFAGTPLGQGRRLDHHTFLNKPTSNTDHPSEPRLYGTRPAHELQQDEGPALVRYARLKQLDLNNPSSSLGGGAPASPPKPEKWSVKDTTVNIANAFTLAAEDIEPMQQPVTDPNSAWASGSRTTTTTNTTTVPRSTSVEYEKETQSTSNRRFAPPPNRLAPPPSRSNGAASRKPLSKQVSVRHVPDSEGEEDIATATARPERGKSPFEHVVDMTKRAFGPTIFSLRQRSQEPADSVPNGHSGQNASYDYSAEEREFQSQKPQSLSARNSAHKKGRMSLDNKAYRPSASDLDDSDDDDDERKVKKRKSKKQGGPHGGPLTTLPTVAGHEKKRKKKRGSKGNVLEMDEDDSTGLSDEHHSEQRASAPNSRTSQSRGSIPYQYQDDDSGLDIEQGLDSIPEIPEHPLPTNDQYPIHPTSSSSPSFSIGGLLGKLVNLLFRFAASILSLFLGLITMTFMLIGRVCGTAFEVVFSRPGQWISNAGLVVGLVKWGMVGLTVYAAWWYAVDSRSQSADHGHSLIGWLPSLPSSPFSYSRLRYLAPDVPAADIAELSARLQAIENALSGLSMDQERSRVKLDTEVRSHAEVVGRLGSLETRIQREGARALEAEERHRASAGQGLLAVRQEVEVLQAQLRAHGSGAGERGDTEASDEEARVRLKALEERVGSVEGGVKDALEMGKNAVKASAAGGSATAWWNKLTAGRSGLTIKSTDGQDVTSLIGHLVDSAVSLYGKDNLARPDFALHSSGAKTIPSLTSPTFEIRPHTFRGQLLGMVTGNGFAIGRPPVTALHHELHNGHCWPFAGTEGQLAVALAAPAYISDITIDHVAKEVAFDMRSAPREMEVWGMVEGKDNIARVQAWQTQREAGDVVYPPTLPRTPQYVRIANFTYDIHAPRNIQTFPVDAEIQALGVDFGIVALRIRSNWGRDEYTCLYRFRVHGQRMGETPLPYPEENA